VSQQTSPTIKNTLKQVLRHETDTKAKIEKLLEIAAHNNLNPTDTLIQLMQEDWWTRKEAERILPWLAASEKADKLAKNLNHPNKYVRTITAVILGLTRNPQATKPLINALKDPDSDVRAASARALGMIKHPQATKPLTKALNDPNWIVRYAAAWALGTHRNPKLLGTLAEHAQKDPEPTVRWELTKSLGKIGKPALKHLIKLLKDPDWQVRETAAYSLGKIKHPKALKHLTKILQEPPHPITKTLRQKTQWAIKQIKSHNKKHQPKPQTHSKPNQTSTTNKPAQPTSQKQKPTEREPIHTPNPKLPELQDAHRKPAAQLS